MSGEGSPATGLPPVEAVVDVMKVLGAPPSPEEAVIPALPTEIDEVLGAKVRTVGVPDCVMVVSLHVVSDGIEVGAKVSTVVIPDDVIVVSLHVVSIDIADGASVSTIVVPDDVMVVSLHVVSKGDTDGARVSTVVVPDVVIVVSLQVVSIGTGVVIVLLGRVMVLSLNIVLMGKEEMKVVFD